MLLKETEVLTINGWKPINELFDIEHPQIAFVDIDNLGIKFRNDYTVIILENANATMYDGNIGIIGTLDQELVQVQKHVTNKHIIKINDLLESTVPITLISAGNYDFHLNLDMTCREMVFLLSVKLKTNPDTKEQFLYAEATDSYHEGYLTNILNKLNYEYRSEFHPESNITTYYITSKSAIQLFKQYYSDYATNDAEFNWKWIHMNNSQACYFLFNQVSKHVHDTFDRVYHSDNDTNLDVVQAICALNQRGSKKEQNNIFMNEQYRIINMKENQSNIQHFKVDECVEISISNNNKQYGYIVRQNGIVTVVK